jgi:lysophospholipase L1-like esterase
MLKISFSSAMKRILLNLLLAFIAVALVCICCESYFRVRYGGLPETPSKKASLVPDKEFGWLPCENNVLSTYNETFPRKKLNKHGFRMFGDPESSRVKVLFVGDSYTQASQVPCSDTYYAVLAKMLPIEVFAFGGNGYGTLQELMIIEKYLDIIKPDAVVIQYCINDFFNNCYDLEKSSIFFNNQFRRPYLTEKNHLFYKTPTRLAALRQFASNYSRFLLFVVDRINRLRIRFYQRPAEDPVVAIIQSQGTAFAPYQKALVITENILGTLRGRIPQDVPVFAFCTYRTEPFYSEFRRISQSNAIMFIDNTEDAIDQAQKQGTEVLARDDVHWNATGHRIIADELAPYLREVIKSNQGK